jgi:serine/threonine-protein kinase RsbW
MLDNTATEAARSAAGLRAWADELPRPVRATVLGADLSLPFVFREVVAANNALSPLRQDVTGWSRSVGFTGYGVDDMVLAVDEAVANSIEHGYRHRRPDQPGMVVLFAACAVAHQMAHVVVADNGSWRPPPADSGTRGRGLPIIEKVTDTFQLHHDDTGTVTMLGWKLP